MFSPFEDEVIAVITGFENGCTVSQVANTLLQGVGAPRQQVSVAIRRINKKCEYHKLKWFINGVGLGRRGKRVWIDRRKR